MNGDMRMPDRSRVEERVHQREAIFIPFENWLRALLERLEHGPETQEVFTQTGTGRTRPGGGIAPLDVAAHLRTEAELEAATGELLEIPCQLGTHQGTPRKRDRHIGAEGQVAGVFGSNYQGEEWVVTSLGHGDAVEPQVLGPTRR